MSASDAYGKLLLHSGTRYCYQLCIRVSEMELAEGRSRRPARANAGSNLQALLERGLDSEEERLLAENSEDSSDSSFTVGSDVEVDDEIDSDFSNEEIEGTLRGEEVETEKDVRRAERRERRAARSQAQRRMETFASRLASAQHRRRSDAKTAKSDKKVGRKHTRHRSSHGMMEDAHGATKSKTRRGRVGPAEDKSQTGAELSAEYRLGEKKSEDDNEDEDDEEGEEEENDVNASLDLRSVVRHRPAPTIPHAVRMQAALARAEEQQQLLLQQQQAYHHQAGNSDEGMKQDGGGGGGGAVPLMSSLVGSRVCQSNLLRPAKSSSALRQRRERQKQQQLQQHEGMLPIGSHQGDWQRSVSLPLSPASSRCVKVVDWPSTAYDYTAIGADEPNREKGRSDASGSSSVLPRMSLQHVCYRSGVEVWKRYGVPTIISFSRDVPLIFK